MSLTTRPAPNNTKLSPTTNGTTATMMNIMLRLGLRATTASMRPPTALLPPPPLQATENTTVPPARPPTATMPPSPTPTRMLGLSKQVANRPHPGLENLTTPSMPSLMTTRPTPRRLKPTTASGLRRPQTAKLRQPASTVKMLPHPTTRMATTESHTAPTRLQPTASTLARAETTTVMPGAETRSSKSILHMTRPPPRNMEPSLTTNGTTKIPHTTVSRRGTKTPTRMLPLLTAKPPPKLPLPTVKVHTVLRRPRAPMVLPLLNTATTLGLRMLPAKTTHPDMASLTIPSLPRTTTTRAMLAKSMLLTINGPRS